MTRFNDTPDATAFIATASSRETDKHVMQAIALCATNLADAERIWTDGPATARESEEILYHFNAVTRLLPHEVTWGDQTLDVALAAPFGESLG